MYRGAWWATVHGFTKELGMTEWLNNNNHLLKGGQINTLRKSPNVEELLPFPFQLSIHCTLACSTRMLSKWSVGFLLSNSVTLLDSVPSWIPQGRWFGCTARKHHSLFIFSKVNNRDLNPLICTESLLILSLILPKFFILMKSNWTITYFIGLVFGVIYKIDSSWEGTQFGALWWPRGAG